MAYRKRTRMSAKLAAARAAKAQRRLDGPAPDYPAAMPDLRRTVIVIDHDFGTVEHRLDLYQTSRIDCYRVVADGVEWQPRMGWSRVLAALRRSLPRVSAS